MQKHIYFSITIFLCLARLAEAQSFERLGKFENYAAKVFYSTGQQTRADLIARRLDRAMHFYQDLLGVKPQVTLLILSPDDWKTYTSMGAVYGMPHYVHDKKMLVVAAEDNPFWRSFVPPLDQLPQDLSSEIQKVYKTGDGSLSMQAFFDLLAIHELGHAFHNQSGVKMQRNWMGEVFVNILLHTFIAEIEPELLPALTAFPRMVVAGGSKGFKYTTLGDVEEHYNEIARDSPRNYGWYQCRWHTAAGGIYDAEGKAVGKRLWNALRNTQKITSDENLAYFLEKEAGRSVAEMITNWDQETKKFKY